MHGFTLLTSPSSTGGAAQRPAFMGFMTPNRTSNEARMERSVSLAARNLGDGVQKIVMAAKGKREGGSSPNASAGEWKTELLKLLGATRSEEFTSDIDTLLENSTCEHFVFRCVENELPPNLIHCLRLLRVLELQHANEASVDGDGELKPVGEVAAKKVSRLLCLMCVGSSVGEQLRPHLFGLLALSGASYPPSGVHVARAASEVICAFSDSCLSRQLVWFIHDRKMVIHMTDDIKELCGISKPAASAAPEVPHGLEGKAAEKAGLWAIALRTVVKLVSFSCRHQSLELEWDFEAAGGYDALLYAIKNTTGRHGKELIELLPILAYCPTEVQVPDENGNAEDAPSKLAKNLRVFEIIEELQQISNPLLKEFRKQNPNRRPYPSREGELQELASFSVETAVRLRATDEDGDTSSANGVELQFDMSSELLGITLQLFADHPENYYALEGRQHILSFFLLAFPCFEDDDLKNFILKTLEFVLTGVGGADEATPMNACVEMFFSMCQTLLKGEDNFDTAAFAISDEKKAKAFEALSADASLVGETLEKLLQFDQRVAPLIVESGMLATNLNALLNVVGDYVNANKKTEDEQTSQSPPDTETLSEEFGNIPAAVTPLDGTFQIVARVLKLLVAHQPVIFSKELDSPSANMESTSLHTMLRMAVKGLGTEACHAAASVFEAYMASFASLIGLKRDMVFVLQILDHLAILCRPGENNQNNVSVLEREVAMISMLRSVLEARSLARGAFRDCGGFDVMIRVILSLKDTVNDASPEENPNFTEALLKLLQALISLLDAALGNKSRNPLAASEASPLTLAADYVVDPVSSQISSQSPAALNRIYLRERRFYLDFAVAIAGCGILSTSYAGDVLDLIFSHVDPSLKSSRNAMDKCQSIRNPDAIRLILGVAIYMPGPQHAESLSTQALDTLIHLCDPDRADSTLPQIASCGICWSLTNPKEFAPILDDSESPLQHRFINLLSRIAAFSMSYSDFIGVLRCFVGPLLRSEGIDSRIRLPVISAAISESSTRASSVGSSVLREEEFCRYLETLSEIASNAARYPRLKLGGDSIHKIAVQTQKVKLEDSLRRASEEGRLKFVEIESIDALALATESSSTSLNTANSSNAETWAPLSNAGFTYSLWLRHEVCPGDGVSGSFHILDISSPLTAQYQAKTNNDPTFLSVWYDILNQRFNVMSASSKKAEPTCFPVSPLLPFVWHHILVTYSPPKRSMINRKSNFSIFVDGRPLEVEVRVDNVNLPPNSRVIVGAPNPTLAVSGVVRGLLPTWELGPMMLLSTVLLDLDATAIYAYGPDFPGLLWGDRPQRLSLAATGTSVFSMLADTGEAGSVASALRRRGIPKLETVGSSTLGNTHADNLSSMNLLCSIPADNVVFGFQATTVAGKMRNEASKTNRLLATERLVNLARLNYGNDAVSTDGVVYGRASVIAPLSFADCLQWVGGPTVLLPLANAAPSPHTLSLALKIIRESCHCHQPNLEMMQAGGGYRVLAVLLKDRVVDERCLDQCLAFALHGYDEFTGNEDIEEDEVAGKAQNSQVGSRQLMPIGNWMLGDLGAMKHLLLNHQVWDLRKYGPKLPLRLLRALNHLVEKRSVHKAFNARRLHLAGIVRWALHLMIEAAELFSLGEFPERHGKGQGESGGGQSSSVWSCEAPFVADVSVGGDPGNPFLQYCKNLLRRVLTFMLTPGDLEALAEAIVFTASIGGSGGKPSLEKKASDEEQDERMLPGATMRLYLVRLLEELIVDGVNEIVFAGIPAALKDVNSPRESAGQPHAAGVASPNQPYLSFPATRGKTPDGGYHPKHQQAQSFLSAFAGFLTPAWFATVLEGCREEASASAVLRLMILLSQGSSAFETALEGSGGFAPFVLSVPRFSTCPGITVSLLSQLLQVPILHLHSLPSLDPEQLCEVFDSESDDSLEVFHQVPGDPSGGIFSLLAECLGRNMQTISSGKDFDEKAKETNLAVLQLLTHRHCVSLAFQAYCCTSAFLEPLSQALCLVCDEKLQQTGRLRSGRRSSLADVPRDLTPSERFVGCPSETESDGFRMLRFLRMVICRAITADPGGARVIRTIFGSFPIHASPQQVEAFHLIVIEQCRSVLDEILENGDGVTLSNAIGMCSVLLDNELQGFLNSEATLDAVKMGISILNALTKIESHVARTLDTSEHSLLTRDAAHLVNLLCVTSLRISQPLGTYDHGDDDDLQYEVLQIMHSNIDNLLLVAPSDRKSNRKIPTAFVQIPAQSSKLFPIWMSASITRCSLQGTSLYPDLSDNENPELAVLAPLVVILLGLLIAPREDVRSLAISVLVALLQHRPNIMSELLVAEIQVDGRTETIDVVNRGGFRALLAAHEAASISKVSSPASLSVKRKYSSFFEWFDKNQDQVQVVVDSVNDTAVHLFPGLQHIALSQEEAVEKEQKMMLMKLTTQGSSDRTMLGALERGELARRCCEKTSDNHSQWKRQGFDDLAFGAMKWKVLLRQLKGSSSIWEGGGLADNAFSLDLPRRLSLISRKSIGKPTTERKSDDSLELVKRWKLDLTEGYERQRRRLLPNYEFQCLYNLDESVDPEVTASDNASENPPPMSMKRHSLVGGGEMEATTALLKELNLKRTHREDEEESEYDDTDAEGEDEETVGTSATGNSAVDKESPQKDANKEDNSTPGDNENDGAVENSDNEAQKKENEDSSSYELITGLLQAGDWPEKSYNVRRCTGLEVTKALLLWCSGAIYVIDGFEQTGDGIDGKITRVEREKSRFDLSLRSKNSKLQKDAITDEEFAEAKTEIMSPRSQKQPARLAESVLYQHRSQRIAFSELYSVYRRRYQLQQNALEFFDVQRTATLIAFDNDETREIILSKVLQSKLPNSIFSSSYGTFISYSKFMNNLKAKIVSQWVAGKMSNFDFIMHLNSFAGRSFNDLTQYPVFPWVIADYDSEEIDLDDPKIYRDLSKPMGALGEERAQQFRARYEALASTCFSDDDPPPFHYGTHYSCAAYVLYYLMRLEPFSRLALALQGGRFDVADRLFHDVGRSWKSASSENLQDVRELIPEFFYLPDFLKNTNDFDFGETQRGKTVHDVSLPKWAKGDPKLFVRLNRQALESNYVSSNLHHWIDLIFGYKQRGKEATDALNTFVHVTYEGEVDLDALTDPIQRASTIAQIENFGQTPSKIERKPFPQRLSANVLKENTIDVGALSSLAPLTPPFCLVGAHQKVHLRPILTDMCTAGVGGPSDRSVGDMCLINRQLIGVGRLCTLIVPAKKYYRFGGLNNGCSVHTAAPTMRHREANTLLSIHDSLHRAPISVAKSSQNGEWLVTGCVDSTLRVWKYGGGSLDLRATLCGHDGFQIKCIDVSSVCGVIASGCTGGNVLLWDLRTLTFVRRLKHQMEEAEAISVSINHKNGNTVTLVGSHLSLFDINGDLLARNELTTSNQATCAVATDCPEWMGMGVAAITGHLDGEVRFWSVDFQKQEFVPRHLLDDNPHTSAITALRVTGAERQDTLLVGDSSGKMSVCKTVQLDSYSPSELSEMLSNFESNRIEEHEPAMTA